ncbi:MAG TPA: NADP-dependent malic enzyme [Thermoanaerobaculaceae bacterium]|mgnify:CR=1 FL=1|nr:NADP-dependent malic enzyme [Thermoanaerobaculaceae bacterium]HRS17398.1 NADP-dependent malic enzyme [Thermoanaerobaculaceae bacterium]
MGGIDLTLSNLETLFPAHFSKKQLAVGKTTFLKEAALLLHRFYAGKIMTVPKAGLYGFNWFNVWYTPGVSRVSTAIRGCREWPVPGVTDRVKPEEDPGFPDASFALSNRGNLVGVVSDSTRVLGDGDVTPPGGLGVMEGKAFLMKYLGGIDAVALCIDSREPDGTPNPDSIIEFVKRVQPSFGAINLEDIQQPDCYKVLDTLREACDIPVWHDDAQGTGCVTATAFINALKVVGKDVDKVRIVMIGAGASNTTIARLLIQVGADPEKMVLFDTKGALHTGRDDIKRDHRFYRKWELCEQTNPGGRWRAHEEAFKGADVMIALSSPCSVQPAWVRLMADKAIVFACANPVPEIYPHEAKEAGAYIVATGRGDYPNQVNNSLGFPGILKGALIVRARKITDNMAVAAARSLAESAERKGLSPEYIIPKMSESEVFPEEAAAVAAQAVADGVARIEVSREEVYRIAERDIQEAQRLHRHLMDSGFIKEPPAELLEEALRRAIAAAEQV